MVTDVVVVVLAVCAGAIALLIALALTVWAGRGPQAADVGEPEPDGHDPDPATLAEQAREFAAHAVEAARRAERAAAAMDAAGQRYAEADERRTEVEAQYDAARLQYAEALRVVRAGQAAPQTDQDRHRQHEVESAALAAFRRGDLSVDELRTVFARAGDWDPEQEAREREAERLAVRESQVRREYEIAVVELRMATQGLHIAEVAAAACTQEAVDAAVEAQVAADELDRTTRRR